MRAWGYASASALILLGCVSTQETFTADGTKGHVISCTAGWSGGVVGAIATSSTNWGTCFQKAGEICGARGYTVLHRSDEPGFAAHVGQYGGHASTTNNRMMIVRCGEAGPQIQAKR